MATVTHAQVTVRVRWRPPEEPPDQYIVEVIFHACHSGVALSGAGFSNKGLFKAQSAENEELFKILY